MVHVLPHWNWAGHEKEPIPVFIYSNADEVELFLNGKSLGRKKVGSEPVDLPVGGNVSGEHHFASRFRLRWDVPYQPGTLRAVAYRDGKVVAEDSVRTAGSPARIALVPDRSAIAADGSDLSFVTVRVLDKDGVLCPDATNQVHFEIAGPGEDCGSGQRRLGEPRAVPGGPSRRLSRHGARDCPVGEGIGGDRDRHGHQRRTLVVHGRNSDEIDRLPVADCTVADWLLITSCGLNSRRPFNPQPSTRNQRRAVTSPIAPA